MVETYAFAPVHDKREKIVGLVIGSIKEALISGRLKAGDRLPSVTEMAASMDVGVSSVREALKVLEGLCVVECQQGRGTYICSDLREDSINAMTFQLLVMPRSTQQLYEFRKMFETAYTFMAVENATDEDLEKIRVIVEALEEKAKTLPVETGDERDFHMSVLSCTHNAYVIRLGETMIELILSTIQKQPNETRNHSVPKDHRMLYEALATRNKKKVQAALECNFKGWEDKYFS